MKEILVTWIGNADVKAMESKAARGPIAQAVADRRFDVVMALTNYSPEVQASFLAWLPRQTAAEVGIHAVELTSPTNFAEIFVAAKGAVDRLEKLWPEPRRLTAVPDPVPLQSRIRVRGEVQGAVNHPEHRQRGRCRPRTRQRALR